MSNMVVRTNIFSLNAHRNMKNVGLEQQRASNRLASGFRINSAADDAAGLAISETMRAQIRGLDQASRNTQDGQAMITVTEGALDEMSAILQRVRELLVQGANDTNTNVQRNMINSEIDQLATEINEMRSRAEFNTNQVLNIDGSTDGSAWKFSLVLATTVTGTGVSGETPIEGGWSVPNTAAKISNAVTQALKGRQAIPVDGVSSTPSGAAVGAAATAATVAFFQVGANANQSITFDFARVSGVSHLAHAVVSGIQTEINTFTTAGGAGIGFGARVSQLVSPLQDVMDAVNTVRAELGAVSNRMDHTMRNLDLASENLQDAESRVRNADVAREMMRFTMQNVLQQAAVSMLAQANQLPQNLLQLLR